MSSTSWPAIPRPGRRNNYSLASNQQTERVLRFNVRIATPPPGQDCAAGSRLQLRLQPQARRYGHRHRAVRRFPHQAHAAGDGLTSAAEPAWLPCAPISPICLETQHTARKVSFWYGARSRQEIFYEDYFRDLAGQHIELRLPPRALRAAAGGQLDRAMWGSSTRWCWRNISANTRTRGPWNIISAGRP